MFPYRVLVRSIVRGGFRELSQSRDAGKIVRQFAPDAVFAFASEGRFGGERRGRDAIRAWFADLFATFADFTIEPIDIVVQGLPWATTVATRFRVTATVSDGTRYRNEGMQYVRIRFGTILEDRIYEDSGKLERAVASIDDADPALESRMRSPTDAFAPQARPVAP